jgi:tripartite-type tricarboxylate transporter receptor subunit TctC
VKANPRGLTYGSAGIGSTVHLATEMFKKMAGVDILHVPYKGAGPALGDLVGGHINLMFGPEVNIIPLSRSGELRALAVSTAKRTTMAPELPTVAEAGLAGFEVAGWYGLAAPVGTPKDVVAKLNAAINGALRSPALAEQLSKQGLDAVGGTAQESTDLIKVEVERWTKLIREAGIQAQ